MRGKDLCDLNSYAGDIIPAMLRKIASIKPWEKSKQNFCEETDAVPLALNDEKVKISKSHMRLHTTSKSYICKICNRSFLNNDDLKRHNQIYTSITTLKFDECSKQFIQYFFLKEHMRIHIGEKPHIVVICQDTYT